MHLSLFVLFAICIAANSVQTSDEITTISNLVDVNTTKSSTDNVTTGAESKDNEDQSKEVESHGKNFDHGHKDHHEHEATITVDVHNILDLFKQQLKQTEQHIITALKKDDSSSSSSSKESYRTADRNAKKQNKKMKDEKKETKENEKEENDDDD